MLIDVLIGDPEFGPLSRDALAMALEHGSLVACEVVWAELAGAFDEARPALDGIAAAGVRFSGLEQAAAVGAGERWRTYRSAGGTRHRMVADFLIAGHATHQADRLLTRDRGFYRTYFEDLEVLTPGEPA